ncbi:MAG: hypothetical protein ACQERS_11220 [Bacteroidota bacterium]
MIKGGILYYTLYVLLISTLITGSILLLHSYQNLKIIDTVEYDKLIQRVNSGILLAAFTEDLWEIVSYDNYRVFYGDTSSINLSVKPWGALTIISADGRWKNYTYKKTALIGIDPSYDEKISISLADNGRGLSLSGSTIIKGTCYLPDKRIKAASIEGQPFSENTLINGNIKESEDKLPKIRNSFFSHIYSVPKLNDEDFLKVMNWSNLQVQNIENTFTIKPILVYSQGSIDLTESELKGNIIVFSEVSIEIDSSCMTEDVIVIAPEINIDDGFVGSLQAFSDKSIQVGKRCILLSPSVLAVGNPVSGYAGKKSITIESNSDIHGTLLISNSATEPEIEIKEKSRIFGPIYCPGQVTLKSDVFGTIYCNSFFLETKKAKYINHLLNVEVNPFKLSDYYVGARLLETQNNIEIAKWLD